MVITDDTNTAVAPGLSLAAHLRAELTAFAAPGNAPGAALLGPLLANGNVQVTIKNKGATATSGTRVTVNTAKTNGIGNEFVESVIFELTNASNAVAFTALENGIKLGATAVRTYGRNKADLEAEASWNVAQILPGRLGYVPSAFGANTILACQNHLNLPAFRTFFRVQPHDATAAINTVMRLPSEEMYAYNGAVIVAATTGVLSRAFTVTDARENARETYKGGETEGGDGAYGGRGHQHPAAPEGRSVLLDADRVVAECAGRKRELGTGRDRGLGVHRRNAGRCSRRAGRLATQDRPLDHQQKHEHLLGSVEPRRECVAAVAMGMAMIGAAANAQDTAELPGLDILLRCDGMASHTAPKRPSPPPPTAMGS
jgi:hypothetical protein